MKCPVITYSNVGDMADASIPGGLRSIDDLHSVPPSLTGTPDDRRIDFFQIPRWRQPNVQINNGDLVTKKLSGKLNLFLVKAQ